MQSKDDKKDRPNDPKAQQDIENARLVASQMRKYPWDYFG